ncbi:MAG: MogA/MoaB family molybdenum cofactor biosynthesis protein [Armatimonadaceae bacterium]|jgi:molybdenum cofactor biosynthesis protein B
MSAEAHRQAGTLLADLPFSIVSVTDSRDARSDLNMAWLREAVVNTGGTVVSEHRVRDEPDLVRDALQVSLEQGARVVVFNGGTGVASRDTTVDTVALAFDRHLPGFGELFRLLSWEQVGAAAMLSRADAGIIGKTVVFCLPGSPKAVHLAWERLIAPEIRHIVAELNR